MFIGESYDSCLLLGLWLNLDLWFNVKI